ncbi:MAG: ribulose-phosphate 3-epimerase [Spirochaetes bacterium]|nr:MAG: ribulose-phosphate 3-epimerase [Spirochaetota bacterium]
MSNTKRTIKISPSMMCADFLNLAEDIKIIEESGFDYLHIDIMDGHYVPNLTLGPGYCEKLKPVTNLPLDIHLMVEDVDQFIPMFSPFSGSNITFHPECCRHPLRTIEAIRSAGCRPGIAVDPAQPLEVLRHMLPAIDFILLMTVNPGYSGGKLVPGAMNKIQEFAHYRDEMGVDLEIEIDGNVSWDNIPKMINAGADTLVVGTSSLFETKENRRRDAARLLELIGR